MPYEIKCAARRDLGLSWPIVQRALTVHADEVLEETPAATEAVGIDESRRGKPVWKQNPDTGKWELLADAWHIGFVDALGGRGLCSDRSRAATATPSPPG